MRTALIAIILIFGRALLGHAEDGFRVAAIAAIHSSAPQISVDQIHLLAVPLLKARLEGVRIVRARLNSGSAAWELQLACVPQIACVPTMAVVESAERSLFHASARQLAAKPLVRPGERKQLTAEIGPVRFMTQVTCLQPGMAGDQIRVREVNSRRVHIATVGSDGGLVVRRTK